MTPVYLTSTYVQDGVGNHKGFEYSRTHNPTRSALEAAFAALEYGKHGLAFASGLAAMDTVLKTLQPGDEVISTNDLYGGSYRLFTTVFAHYGITFHFVDLGNLDALKEALNDRTRMVWIETPTNPMMQITDIAAVAEVVKGLSACGGGQHLRFTHIAKSPRIGRGHGDAQCDEVPRGTLGCGHGMPYDLGRRLGGRTSDPPKLMRCRFRPHGLLPRPSRD